MDVFNVLEINNVLFHRILSEYKNGNESLVLKSESDSEAIEIFFPNNDNNSEKAKSVISTWINALINICENSNMRSEEKIRTVKAYCYGIKDTIDGSL